MVNLLGNKGTRFAGPGESHGSNYTVATLPERGAYGGVPLNYLLNR